MTLKIIVVEKHNSISEFSPVFRSFVNCLPCLINERSHTTLLAFEEGKTEHMFRGRKWLYGFDSVFSQVSVVILIL